KPCIQDNGATASRPRYAEQGRMENVVSVSEHEVEAEPTTLAEIRSDHDLLSLLVPHIAFRIGGRSERHFDEDNSFVGRIIKKIGFLMSGDDALGIADILPKHGIDR